ncbi:MAG: DUF1801 domain-containing protein [Xanthomonadales bacterium]
MTAANVAQFIDALEDPHRQADCRELIGVMREICGCEPAMWGGSMVGFGQYHYRYDSGREGSYFVTGFAPRKTALTVYIMPGFAGFEDQLEQLGPHKTGRSCLYLKRLDAVDRDVLGELIRRSVDVMRALCVHVLNARATGTGKKTPPGGGVNIDERKTGVRPSVRRGPVRSRSRDPAPRPRR